MPFAEDKGRVGGGVAKHQAIIGLSQHMKIKQLTICENTACARESRAQSMANRQR